MENTTQRLRRLGCGVVLTSAVALAGCGNFEAGHAGDAAMEGHNVSAAKTALPGTSDFTGSLAADYYAMATIRNKDGDKIDADYWARKSMAAAKGQVVLPEQMKVVAETSAVVPAEGARGEVEHETNWNIPGLADPAHSRERPGASERSRQAREPCSMKAAAIASRLSPRAARPCTIAGSSAAKPTGSMIRASPPARPASSSDHTDLNVLLHPPGERDAYFDYNSATLTARRQTADRRCRRVHQGRHGETEHRRQGRSQRCRCLQHEAVGRACAGGEGRGGCRWARSEPRRRRLDRRDATAGRDQGRHERAAQPRGSDRDRHAGLASRRIAGARIGRLVTAESRGPSR